MPIPIRFREDVELASLVAVVDCASLYAVAEHDHAQLRAQIDCLTSLLTEKHALSPEDFQATLVDCVNRFCSCLREHLSFEDGLLWPIAPVVVDDPAVRRTMKAVCEEIGYCGIHAT